MKVEVQAILSGNSQAIEKFYTTYAPKIRKYLANRLPENEDIEAFTNDILLDIIDSLPLFQGKSSFSSWIYKIAHNKVVDFYRKKKVKSLLLSQMPFLELMAQEVYEPEFQFEKNKIRDNIQVTLRNMSQKYRKILELHYIDKKSVKEIALVLDMSPKATESLLFRARQEFKKSYAAK